MGPVPWKMANFNPGLSVIGEFEMDFISNDDITSVLCKHVMCFLWPPPGLKTGVENEFFLPETEGQYLENRATHPHQ